MMGHGDGQKIGPPKTHVGKSDVLRKPLDRRQVEHVKEGLRQAEAGEFATDAEIATAFARWRQ